MIQPSLIAVVVPVFRHSALLGEALASIEASCAEGMLHTVIVDDGCPYFQTAFSGSVFAGGNVHYIRQVNRGLSGARNCGVEFVLSHLKDCEAIYFLDADNRLSPHSFRRFQDALLKQPNIDWFYPDLRMFGIPVVVDFSGPFRNIFETVMNICEAGSLVRRRVFESGCRFDEDMRSGYEDWDFWLTLCERNFTGMHLPASGFQYRKRAESMLAESERLHSSIMAHIEKKHAWLRDVRTLVTLEHNEAPRFAVLCTESGLAMLGSDPMRFQEMTLKEYSDRLKVSFERPNWIGSGYIVVFATVEIMERLRKTGLARGLFWYAEQKLRVFNFVSVTMSSAEDSRVTYAESGVVDACDLLFMSMRLSRSVLSDTSDIWIRSIVTLSPDVSSSLKIYHLNMSAPDLRPVGSRLENQRVECCEFFRRERLNFPPALWSGRGNRHEGTPDLSLFKERLEARFQNGILPCCADTHTMRVAFALPIVEFGGVEKVSFQVAREFRKRGFQVDLLVFGLSQCFRHDASDNVFSDIYFINHIPVEYNGSLFEGTHLPTNTSRQYPEVGNLLRSYDVIVNCNASSSLTYFAEVRREGVVTINYVHLLEFSAGGRATGLPIVALAYEHCIDLIACCSHQMGDQMAALGAPREKIVVVPNGAGVDISEEHKSLALQERELRGDDALRVLYFGRLDAQKGLDRLEEIHAALRERPDLFEVRVIGSQIVDQAPALHGFYASVEPPEYDNDRIVELYLWADVLILPSRFEGLPLVVIEAITMGCVPIVTDVGAVAEVVSSGENGYIVPNDQNAAAAIIEHLNRLTRERLELARLSKNAIAAASGRNWPQAAENLIDHVIALCEQRKPLSRRRPHFRVSPIV